MAIDPALQLVSEREMIAATISVITNTRPDHADVMGSSPAEVAAALSCTVPTGGILVLGPVDHPELFEAEAARRRSRVVRANAAGAVTDAPAWMAENLGVALAVTALLGIPDQLALSAMTSAPEDPGTMRLHPCTAGGRVVTIVNASAANDPESLQMLLDGLSADGRLFVFNHRGDRPLRLRQFAESPLWKGPGTSVLVTGDTPDCATRKVVGLALEAARVGFAPLPLLARTLREQLAADTSVTTVVLCGNARNLDADALIAGVEKA
jgi:poly-gamma-glutamate synthase PgsB/CapB